MKISHLVDHVQARAVAYPSVEDQLDMLWHSMSKGEIPKSEPFYSLIGEVKSLYPKPVTDNGLIAEGAVKEPA